MDWFLRPVVRRMCSFESLKDGKVDVEDLALLNDVIDLSDENQRRAEEAAMNKARNG